VRVDDRFFFDNTPNLNLIHIAEARSPYTVDGLENGKTYYFAVTAENDFGESDMSVEVSAKPGVEVKPPKPEPGLRERVHLKFRVPKGKVAGIMGVMNLLQSKFENLSIEIEATDGEITDRDYEDKIKEAFRQLGVEVEG